jgi:DNA-binding NtrC family response regulator
MGALFAEVARLAASDAPVHLFGETGTGKECVARALHAASSRAAAPFVALNASSFSDELFESEMFGHARGAFTGAVQARDGQVAAAHGGTLFLDEVADLSLRSQAKLLRFLEDREYRRLGENTPRRADVRIVSAANVRLEERAGRGAFRPDLRYRLEVLTLTLPPLRERGDDVLLLARSFVLQAASRWGLPAPELPPAVEAALLGYSWPGNVRQLRNEAERLVALAGGGPLSVEHLSPEVRRDGAAPISGLRQARAEFDRRFLRDALVRHAGNRTRTAAALGVSRQGLGLLLSRHGLSNL